MIVPTPSKAGPFDAIVLAAGQGRRFGGRKLLATFQGRPLIAGALAAALSPSVRQVTVVTAGDVELDVTVRQLAADWGEAGRLRLVVAEQAHEGMGASLGAGARALADDVQGVLVFLGDMPTVSHITVTALVEAFRDERSIVAPVLDGRRGHPVLFGRAWLERLGGLRGDVGARDVVGAAGEALVLVQVDADSVLFDVDLRSDLI